MKIINGKGTMPMQYEIQLVTAHNYTSVELWVKAPGMPKTIFLDNHTIFGNDSDITSKAALIGAENKWQLDILKFDINQVNCN